MKIDAKLVFIVLLVLGAAIDLSGQEEEIAVKPVKEIIIEGTKQTNPEMIKRKIRTKIGEPLNKEQLIRDLHRIYEMGFFRDVRRFLEEDEDGYRVIINAMERPYVLKVAFKGNSKIKAKTLEKSIKTKVQSFLFEYHVEKRDIDIIKELYVDQNYFNVEAYATQSQVEGGVLVTYHITENHRAEIERVTFIGNESIPEYELKRTMKTDFYGFLPDRIYRKKIFKEDLASLRSYYRNKGFLESKVDYRIVFAAEDSLPSAEEIVKSPDRVLKYGTEDIGIYIFILIDEGVRYTFGKVSVVGNKEEIISFSKIEEVLTIKEGEDYSALRIMGNIRAITRLYGNKGYAFARVNHEEKFDFGKRRVNVDFHIAEGNLYLIQDVIVIGNERTKLQVILREIDIAQGDQYNYSKEMAATSALRRIGLFRDVRVYKRRGAAADQVVIIVEVKEERTGAFEAILSYDEHNKFAGTVVLKQKNFDVLGMWKGRFTGAAHELSLQYFGSPVTQDLSLYFKNPRLFDGLNSLRFKVSDQTATYTEYSQAATKYFLGLGRELLPNFNVELGMNFKDIDIFDVNATAPQVIQDELGLSRIRAISLRGSLNRVEYYAPYFEAGGFSIGGEVEYAGDFLSATREFVTVSGWLNFYETLYQKPNGSHIIWKVRLSGKAANEMGDETAIPLSERQALGGIRSVRGFATYSIGPYVAGDNVRGDAHALFSTEVMFPLKWDPVNRRNFVHGVLYFDAGGVWAEAGEAIDAFEDGDFDEVRSSVGMGLRLYPGGMPIPIEFYWSVPFAKSGDKVSRFQIGIFGMPF